MNLRVALAVLVAGVLCIGAWWALRSDPIAPAVDRAPASSVDSAEVSAPLAAPDALSDRATIDETAAVAPSDVASPTHRIVGRVIDEQRRPVSDAQVSISDAERTQTGSDGRFVLDVRRADETTARQEALVARDARGRSDYRALWLTAPRTTPPVHFDAGTLVLSDGAALQVSVVAAGVPAAGALVQVELGHPRDPLCLRKADESGRLSLDGLPHGPVHVTASLPESLGHAMVFVPEEREVVVQLEPLGEVEVQVVDASTGLGIADAELDVSELFFVPAPLPERARSRAGESFMNRPGPGDAARTDAEGRARIGGLAPSARYSLSVDAAGYVHFPTPPASGPRLQAGADPVTVRLEPIPIRSVSWPVVAGEVPVPPAGSAITFRHQAGIYYPGQAPPLPSAGRMEGSLLVADDVAGRPALIAEAPDGSLAQLWCKEGADQGAQTEFRKPRRVEVHVHDQAGAPVVGAAAVARNQGNNDLCDWATSDEQGIAVLAGLHGGLAEIHVRRPDQGGRGERVGSVDLEQGDAQVEVLLAEPTWTRARLVLLVDGAPGLPPRFSVSGHDHVRVVSEEPTRGEVALELADATPGAAVEVWVSAPGFASAITTFQIPTDGSEPSQQLALERTAMLVAHVTPPKEGRVSILPQQLDAQGAWGRGPQVGLFSGLSRPNGPKGTYVFPGITRGRWRLFDETSGACSEPIDVVALSKDVEVFLDLSSIEWASGRVELEDPGELARVRIRVLDQQAEPTKTWRPGSEPPDGASSRDGTFRIQVPGDRTVTLAAWHPWLVPDPEQGSVAVRGGREDLVLRLVAGDEVRIPMPALPQHVRAIRVARFAGEPTGQVLEWHHVPVAEGVARCAVPQGTWTLWVDPVEEFAPFLLRDVSVDGVTELPTVELARGSSVRVRILVPEDQSTPRLGLFASSLDALDYGRGMNSDGEEVAVLSGLGPGRFTVNFSSVMGREASVEKIVELDGVNDVELECDLR
jgi:hypothetical protein